MKVSLISAAASAAALAGADLAEARAPGAVDLTDRAAAKTVAGVRVAAAATASDVSAAEAAENALSLSRAARQSVQEDLVTLGFDPKGVDGVFGPGARSAIQLWQSGADRPVTGYVDAEQIAALNAEATAKREAEAKAADAADLTKEEAIAQEAEDWSRTKQVGTTAAYQRYLDTHPEGAHASEARTVLEAAQAKDDDAAWVEAEKAGTTEAYAAYLEAYPKGRHSIEAQRRVDLGGETATTEQAAAPAEKSAEEVKAEEEAWATAQDANTPKAYAGFVQAHPDSAFAEEAQTRRQALLTEARIAREESLALTGEEWTSIEQRLELLGRNVGVVDGRPDDALRQAILAYRSDKGMAKHEYVDRKFVKSLVNDTNNAIAGAGLSAVGQMIRLLDN